MSAENGYVIGICTRLRDASAFIEVRAQNTDGTLQDVSQLSQNLFPPDGEVELRGGRSILKVGDWALAKPVLEGPPRRQRSVSAWSRRLIPFEDLAGLYAPEAARRLLVETGRQDGVTGEKVFRIGPSEMVAVTMVRSEDGRCRATATDMSHLAVLRFDGSRVYSVPTPTGQVSLIEKGPEALQIDVANWSTDIEFVRAVLAAADHQTSGAITADVLLSNAQRLEQQIGDARTIESKIGHEIIRSRHLGELLTASAELMNEFVSVMTRDPAVAKRLDSEIDSMTRAAVESKRAQIAEEAATSLENELANIRDARTKEINEAIQQLEGSMLRDLDQNIRAKESEALSNLEIRRLSLEKAVDSLEKTRDALDEERREKAQLVDVLANEAMRLSAEADERRADVDRFLKVRQALEPVDGSVRSGGSVFSLPQPLPQSAVLHVADIRKWIDSCPLLTETGKRGVIRLAPLLLSGAVPVVTGLECDDLIEALASLIAGGAWVSFDCDPTVIAFDDLWCRPGSEAPTILGAAALAAKKADHLQFCVIRQAELSGSKYWIETLRHQINQGALSANLVLCVVVNDQSASGAEDILKLRSVVRADGWIDRNAGTRLLTARSSIDRVIVASDIVADVQAAASAIALSQASRLSIADVRWLAKLIPLAAAIGKEGAEGLIKDAIDLAANGAKPELKLVDKRGPSHA